MSTDKKYPHVYLQTPACGKVFAVQTSPTPSTAGECGMEEAFGHGLLGDATCNETPKQPSPELPRPA